MGRSLAAHIAFLKTVNYQELGYVLATSYTQIDIQFHCKVSHSTAKLIIDGKGTDDPRASVAMTMIELALAKKLEIPIY